MALKLVRRIITVFIITVHMLTNVLYLVLSPIVVRK